MAGMSEIMREIHRLRIHAHDLQEQLDRIPRQLKAQQAKVTREETALKDMQDAVKKLKVQVKDKELAVATAQAKIKKYAKQLNEAAASKEYASLQKEIAGEKAAVATLEDEILADMAEGEEKAAKLPAMEAAVKKAKQDCDTYAKGVGEQQVSFNAQLAEAQAQLKEVEKQFPEKYLEQYKRLVGAMGADSLAAVVGQNCNACHTEITSQNLHDLRQQMFLTCKSCYRILYLVE